VFDAAGTIFRSSSTVVLILFVLITLTWVSQGIAMFVRRNREYSLGAAGFVTLFLVLFVLVYLPLLSSAVPVTQAVLFLLVPVLAAGASWTAVLVYDWDVTLDEETVEQLNEARTTAKNARETFDDPVGDIDDESTLSPLRSVAPAAVEEFEDGATSFRDRCQTIVARAERLIDGEPGLSSRERYDRATQVVSDAEDLEPASRAESLVTALQTGVKRGVTEQFADIHVVSRFDGAYEIRNLRDYNELAVPDLDGGAIQIGGDQHELAERITEAIDSEGVPVAARVIERALTHVDDLRAELSEHEESIDAILSEIDHSLEMASEHIDGIDGAAGDRLAEYLIDGRLPDELRDVPTRPEIESRTEQSIAALHETRFDDAMRNAETAREDATRVEAIAEFFSESVVSTIEFGSGSIPVPPSVGTALVERMRVPFEQTYGIDYALETSELVIAGDADTRQSNVDAESETRRATTTGDVSADDVLYVLGELKAVASTATAEDSVELQTETLPAKFVTPQVLAEIRTFAERQPDVESVEVPDDPPPGYLSIVVADGASPERLMDTIQNEYAQTR
jgi:hypothetical protein